MRFRGKRVSCSEDEGVEELGGVDIVVSRKQRGAE